MMADQERERKKMKRWRKEKRRRGEETLQLWKIIQTRLGEVRKVLAFAASLQTSQTSLVLIVCVYLGSHLS
jgi:hypothetical protein